MVLSVLANFKGCTFLHASLWVFFYFGTATFWFDPYHSALHLVSFVFLVAFYMRNELFIFRKVRNDRRT